MLAFACTWILLSVVIGAYSEAKGGSFLDGSGEVSRMTFAELKELDAGARFTADGGRTFPYAGKRHRIPRKWHGHRTVAFTSGPSTILRSQKACGYLV